MDDDEAMGVATVHPPHRNVLHPDSHIELLVVLPPQGLDQPQGSPTQTVKSPW